MTDRLSAPQRLPMAALFAALCTLLACGPAPITEPPPPLNFGSTGGGGGGGGGGGNQDGGQNTDGGSNNGEFDGGNNNGETDGGNNNVETDGGSNNVETDGGSNNGETDGGSLTTVVDLRADVNRNGVVELNVASEDALESSWSASAGAVFLANIDDDQSTCPKRTANNQALSDAVLASCNDAADEVINGVEDLEDLARLKTVPTQVEVGAVGSFTVSPAAAASRVRLFKRTGTSWTVLAPGATVSAGELSEGVELAIEAKDIVRDPALWDGFADVTFRVASSGGTVQGEDTVRFRVAPIVTFHHLLAARKTYASRLAGDSDSTAFQAAMNAAATASGVPEGHQNITTPVDYSTNPDQWNQDYFETGYMSMPSAGGGQKVINVAYRSANVYGSGSYPLRPAGRAVFLVLRGRDYAGVQEFSTTSDPNMDTLNSFGNTETVPPYSYNGVSYPLGRSLRGRTATFFPDPKFQKLMEAQKVQPPIYLDTSWLLVAHVDETLSFLKANNARGWVMLANDATMAKSMLQAQANAGNGGVSMFVGKYFYDWNTGAPYSAQVTISATLADPDIMAASAESQVEVDSQVAKMKVETGITDSEIIPVPFLHMHADGYSVAYQPGTVNGIVFNAANFGTPTPHGPRINGVDIFEAQLQQALGLIGYTVHWIEDWDLYHAQLGEVHCASNALRETPSALWWESGR